MKINILFKFQHGPYGGGNQFLKALKKYFIKKGTYEENVEKADAIIFNSFQELTKVIFYKTRYPQKVFIHRIDGPISRYRGKGSEIDRIIYLINKYIADATVFQSEWSARENHELGLEKNNEETVIHNAVDTEIFNERNRENFSPKRKIRLIAVSWSANWNKGFAYYKYLDKNLDFSKYEMLFIGNSPIKFKQIKMISPQPSHVIASYLQKSDIYITASENESCSNSLIEAMRCGLPVVGLNSGSQSEMIHATGELFTQKYEMIEKIEKISQNYLEYKNKITVSSLDDIGNEYYSFIAAVTRDKNYQTKSLNPIKLLSLILHILILKTKLMVKYTS